MLIQKDLLNKLIDLANISIEYLNAKDEDITWITVKGNHIPIKKGQTEEEAFEAFLSKVEDKSSKKVADKTQTKEFKDWFGDSKVVDEDGKPLVVYHGTKKEFDEFDIKKVGSQTDTGMFGNGFYFTEDKTKAEGYAGEKGEVMSMYISMKNPLIINKSSDIPNIEVPEETIEDLENADINYSKAFKEYLDDNGYDGVIQYKDDK